MTATTTAKPAADYRTDAPRKDGWTYEKQAVFLTALAHTGQVSFACAAAKMCRLSAYSLRRAPRGRAFALGWVAARLLARDVLEDRLLDAAIDGVETSTERYDGGTHRFALNTRLSMGMLNRLDAQVANLDDVALSTARAVAGAWEDYLELVLDGGGEAEFAAFLAAHPDPLAAQVAAQAAEKEAAKEAAQARKLVEESAIPDAAKRWPVPLPAAFTLPDRPETPCDCPASLKLRELEAA